MALQSAASGQAVSTPDCHVRDPVDGGVAAHLHRDVPTERLPDQIGGQAGGGRRQL